MFVGREKELESLKALLRKETASLVACRGRRRIGKSTLFYEFARKNKCDFIVIEGLGPRKGQTNFDQLKNFGGDMAIASYGVINRLTFVFAMMVMGLNQGMQPIAGYNYGAKQYERMLHSFYLTCAYATGVMSIIFILGECFPQLVTEVFTHDAVLIDLTIKPMRIICSTMLIIGFQMVTGNLFTSIGKAGKAIFLSLTRQVLYLIPLVLWLPTLFNNPIDGVWWSIPASDTLSAITAIIVLLSSRRKLHME